MIPANAAIAQKYATQMIKKLGGEAKRLAPWGAPAGIMACWMIYPALTADFKKSVGLPYDPKDLAA